MKELLQKIGNAGLLLDIVDGKLKLYSNGGQVDPEILNAIKSNREAITAYLVQNDLGSVSKARYERIPRVPLAEFYAISDAQRRLWVLSQFEGNSAVYNIPGSLYLNQELDIAAFREAIDATIDRHEILRTVFREDETGSVQQWVLTKEALGFKIDYQDLRNKENGQAGVEAYIKEDSYKPFDLEKGPLLRAALLQLEDKSHVFYYNMHHIISDGWSMDVLSRDIFTCYEAFKENKTPALKPLSIQYRDYSAWQLAQLTETAFKDHKYYWLERLKGELPVLDLPGAKQRPRLKTHTGRCVKTYFDETTGRRLKKYSEENSGSLFMGLLAAWTVLMYRYTAQTDIITGVAVAGREHADLEDQIGFYINTLALRNHVSPVENFDQLFSKVKQNTLQAYTHQMYPFDRLVEELTLRRDTSRSAVFDVLLAFNNNGQKIKHAQVNETEINSVVDLGALLVKYDLELHFTEVGDYISIQVNFNEDIYEKASIEQFIKHYKALVACVVNDPEAPVAKIDFLTAEEKRLIGKFNATQTEYPSDKTFLDMFAMQAEKAPGSPALKSRARTLSYKALDELSNQLADCLIRDYGVKPQDLVGIKLDKEEWAVLSMLAVLKAGAAYVPVDPDYPQSRKQHILAESQLSVLITSTNYLYDDEEFEGRVFAVDVEFDPSHYSKAPLNRVEDTSSLAYVIYTSGSTGEAKGVMIEHRSLTNYLYWAWTHYSGGDKKALHFGLFSSLSFDLTITSLFLPLVSGGSLSLFEQSGDISSVLNSYFNSEINCIKLTPAHIGLLKSLDIKHTGIEVAIVGGDKLEVSHAESLRALNATMRIYNEYGPTESTVGCTVSEVLPGSEVITIGGPVFNTEICILNEAQQLQAPGVTGELCIGGDGLARGYLNQEALTKEKFIAHPFKKGARLYKTGDLGKWLPDGSIDFQGRKDDQVKIRGYRIELGEVESVLSRHEGVESCAVVVQENEVGEKELVAYVVPDRETAFTVKQVLDSHTGKLDYEAELYEMENGVSLYAYNKSEVNMLYTEVFEHRTYDRNGISIPPDACIVDIGANVGSFSVYALINFENARVYSFEPLPPIYELLKHNAALYKGRMEVFNVGISDREEEAEFDYYPYATVLSGRHSENYGIRDAVRKFISNSQDNNGADVSEAEMEELLNNRLETKKYKCKLKTLSQVIAENGIRYIDFLKVDAENAEMEILAGIRAEDWERIGQMVLEVFDVDGRLEKVKSLLSARGFEVEVNQSDELDGTHFYDVYAIGKQQAKEKPAVRTSRTQGWYGTNALEEDIRRKLREGLPDYMIPSDIILMPQLPLTANGKIDRKRLAELSPGKTGGKVDIVAPRNEREAQLLEIWKDVLQKENISIKDDFFALGGHSLKAIRLSNEYQKKLDVKLSLKELFAHTSIEAQSELIQRSKKSVFIHIEPLPQQESYPISDAQRRIWVLSQFEGGSVAYNIPGSVYLNQAIQIDHFKKALSDVIGRHEILRTVFREDGSGTVRQHILKGNAPGLKIDYRDFRNSSHKREEVQAYISADAGNAFDLVNGPLLRTALLQVEDKEYVFYYNMHHIISDGWSMEVLYKDILAFYEAHRENKTPGLRELRIQYKDYASWQLAQLGEETFKIQRAYWLNTLSGTLPVLDLLPGKQRPKLKTHKGFGVSAYIGPETTALLKDFSESRGGSLFMGLLTVWNILLYRYTSQTDIITGTPVAGREHADLEDQIGFYVNTLALRNEINPDKSFEELFARVRHTTLEAYAHQMYPFDRLVDELDLRRNTGRNAVFDMMLVLQNNGEKVQGAALTENELNQVEELGQKVAKFDLDFTFQEVGSYLVLHAVYNSDIYDKAFVKRFVRHFRLLLQELLREPGKKISGVDYLPEEEKQELLHLNSNTRNYPEQKTVMELFEQQAHRTPDSIALVDGEDTLTYKALNEQANQLAHYLRKGYGLQPDDLVGIKQEKNKWMVVSILAVLKAGAAYVPLDPDYPQERIEYIEQDTQCKLCIDENELSRFLENSSSYSTADSLSSVKRSSLAYVIYTSGSTGKPKGVMVKHGGLSQFLNTVLTRYSNGQAVTQPFVASFSFDISVFQLFYPLITGGKSILVNKKDFQDTKGFLNVLAASSVIDTVPAMYETLVKSIRSEQRATEFGHIRQVFIGGDKIPDLLLKNLAEIFSAAAIIVTYGPTEATIFCTDSIYQATEKNEPLKGSVIGTPNGDVQVYILNSEGCLQPKGVTGEICIGGPGVAGGYLSQQTLSGENFVDNPYRVGEQLYKTGDLGRWTEDGNIEFIGRKDDQVKIRGYRIELGEIEHALLQNREIEEALVLVKENEEGEKELIAYIVSSEEQTSVKLRAFLKDILPEYMHPAYYVQVEAFPLNSNGKVDKKALPDPEGSGMKSGVEYIAPENEIEVKLLGIWKHVLKREQTSIGIDDGFFEAGGNSIKLIALRSQIEREFKTSCDLASLFQYSTIRLQAVMLLKEKTPAALVADKPIMSLPAPYGDENSDIAVIGMAIRAPGAGNVHEFWENLRSGKESVIHFTKEELLSLGFSEKEFAHKNYVSANTYLEDKECFDAAFFGYMPDEARLMDPQTRVFHEVVWSALEDAGYDPLNYKGLIGLYSGAGSNLIWEAYSQMMNEGKIDELTAHQLSDKDFLNTLIAHKLNLNGSANSINTACSTSLVAIHHAALSLLSGGNNIAVAGGVSIKGKRKGEGYIYQEGMLLSRDGHNRTFDKDASGTLGSEGAGAVVLKRLKDALRDGDQVYAVIKGSAINNDGNRKVGYTAPSVDGQSEVIRMAHKAAGVAPESITYVEAHGTATRLGDPIEVLALSQAFGASENKYCALGSVKTNMGHLDAAAGVAGFIKTVLCLKHKQLVPSLHFKTPNPEINFTAGPFYVNTALKEWPEQDTPRRAGVSSFGIGGTNAHVVLQEAPATYPLPVAEPSPQIITLSAKTPEALLRQQHRVKNFLSENKELGLEDIAWTLQNRRAFPFRSSFVALTVDEAIESLGQTEGQSFQSGGRKVAFMFSGQGAQYQGMGRDLYNVEESVFRKTMDQCFDTAEELSGTDFKDILYPSGSINSPLINETQYTQPILFMFEYSLARQMEHYGIKPDIMIGHSIGEYAAACVAGAMSLKDALKMVIKRAELMQGLPRGAMLAVGLAAEKAWEYLSDEIDLAAVNTPGNCVLSGTTEAIRVLSEQLQQEGIAARLLHTSHAFHSGMMEPVLDEFAELAGSINISPPFIPYFSNVTGRMITAGDLEQKGYWSDHIRKPVKFSEGISSILSLDNFILIEIGPGNTLSTFARQHFNGKKLHAAYPLIRQPKENEKDSHYLLSRISELWQSGLNINWDHLRNGNRPRKISLPAYSFEPTRYPVLKGIHELLAKVFSGNNPYVKKEMVSEWFYEPSWKKSRLVSSAGNIDTAGNYLLFCNGHGIAKGLAERISANKQAKLVMVTVGTGFEKRSALDYALNPKSRQEYSALFEQLEKDGLLPDKIIHFWNVTAIEDTQTITRQSASSDLAFGYYSLLNIARAVGSVCPFRKLSLDVLTSNVADPDADDTVNPARAALLGPVMTIPKEYTNIVCRHVDINAEDSDPALQTRLFNELHSAYGSLSIAYRKGIRWMQYYEQVQLPAVKEFSGKLKRDGVYLVTGAMGGIGMAISRYLSEEFNAKLILTGRKPLAAVDPAVLKNIGDSVIYLDVDVSDKEAMEMKVAQAEAEFGRINGIFHAAGIADYSGIIQNRTQEQCEAVFASKIYGTIVLSELAAGRKADILLLCSSGASIAAPFGSVGYTSANIFQDSFARSAKNNVVQSIGWDTWREAGMAVAALSHMPDREREMSLAFGLSQAEGIEVLKRVLQHDVPCVTVQTRGIEVLASKKEPPVQTGTEDTRQLQSRPVLDIAYEPPVSDTEIAISALFSEYFGITEIGVKDNFFDLGMDSLKAMTLISRIHKKLNVQLRINDILEHATIRDLAKEIDLLATVSSMQQKRTVMNFENKIEL